MPTIDELTDLYFDTKNKLHEALGYKSDWVEIPMSDERGSYWMIVGSEEDGHVVYHHEPLTLDSVTGGNIYSGPIYTQRFLPKWVYRTPTHVMISVNTRTDGNKFLMIFDAAKECTDERIKRAYGETWGRLERMTPDELRTLARGT